MRVLLLLALTGCVVVKPPALHERPRWRITDDKELDTPCVIARALVRRSGKQGIGMALQLKTRGDCEIAFSSAKLVFADTTELVLAPPPPQHVPGRSLVYVWWPIAFDNNAAWNASRTASALHLEVAANDATRTWQIEMVHQ